MVLIRYLLYFLGVAVVTGALVEMEILWPGSLKLLVVPPGATLGTSEYSPIEMMQPVILGVCGMLYAWVARHCPSQRPVAFMFGALALAFLIRELDYFLDRWVADNFWQATLAVAAALIITYTYRHWRRFRIAWLRVWPSPGIALLFAGACIHFAFVRFVGHEALWVAILGDGYQRVIKLALEEFIELMGYYLWLIGTIEYAYQARAIALREPQPAVARRRTARKPKPEGRF
ncbi:MAG TPA: hypothetical protein VF200_10550 [Woeseiaceae bacterium]